MLVTYLDANMMPRNGVPPESISVSINRFGGGTAKVNDATHDPAGFGTWKVFADDSTRNGLARITLPSISGCGALEVLLFVSGVYHGGRQVFVRTTDWDGNGRVPPQPFLECDLNYNGVSDDEALVAAHANHWHRNALHGTPVRRTNACTTCPREIGDVGISTVSWEPNGRRVTFSMNTDVPPDGPDDPCALFMVPADPEQGAQLRKLTFPPGGAGGDDYYETWSPLGTDIFFNRGDRMILRKGIPPANPDTTEYVVTDPPPGFVDLGPDISPDGLEVAFSRSDFANQTTHIYAIPVSGGQARQITSGAYIDGWPHWSPEGKFLVFSRRDKVTLSHLGIFKVLATGEEEPSRITSQALGRNENAAAHSPDGALLVAGVHVDINDAVTYTLDPELINPPLIESYSDYRTALVSPRISPDGTRLALQARPPGTNDRWEVWVTRRNMNQPPVITAVGPSAVNDTTVQLHQFAFRGYPLELLITASDPENDPLRFRAFFLRDSLGMAFDSTTGRFSWTPPLEEEDGTTYMVKFQVTTKSGGSDQVLVRLQVSSLTGGCPYLDVRAVDDWRVENSLLARSLTDEVALDIYRLRAQPEAAAGQIDARVRENGQDITTLDEVRMLAIDHAPEVGAFAVGGRFLVGVPSPAHSVTTTKGADITPLISAEDDLYFAGQPGDTLLVELEAGARSFARERVESEPTIFILNADPKEDPAIPSATPRMRSRGALAPSRADAELIASTGIELQIRDGDIWHTVQHIRPREYPDDILVDLQGTRPTRLVFIGRHRLSFVGRLVPDHEATPQNLLLLHAFHTRLGNVSHAVSGEGGSTTAVAPGDTLNLSFRSTVPEPGLRRDLFFLARGFYASLAPSPSRRVSSLEPDDFELQVAQTHPIRLPAEISFRVPQATLISLDLFDLQGRRVRELARAVFPAGRQQIRWDGRASSGQRVRPGVYLCVLRAHGVTRERKLVILP